MVKSILLIGMFLVSATGYTQKIRVGSKHFNEGYILSEIVAQLLEDKGFIVERHYNLGGTIVCFEALKNNEIDLYPEYSGTLSSEVLKDPGLTLDQIQRKLDKEFGLRITQPYGFSNSYGLICTDTLARTLRLTKISDLAKFKDLKFGLSYEYMNRVDGWNNLRVRYALPQDPTAIEHGLAYTALRGGDIDITDAYTTDGEIARYSLHLLEDDLHFFPEYSATTLFRISLPAKAKAVVRKLEGTISEQAMRAMNSAVLFGNKTAREVAGEFLAKGGFLSGRAATSDTLTGDILWHTLTHLELTFLALFLAVLVAIPLAIALYWQPAIASTVINLAGVLQTIPSIALLAFMIPLFGIGFAPAVVALFLYALLPILRNTLSGLQAVDPLLKNIADGIGMNRYQKLRIVELPLATHAIMAGIRTAAVINVGTATLAAFIGAGGLGEFIVSGLALNNTGLILQGAIPAALLALLIELLFTLLQRFITPKHFRNI